MMRDWIRLRRAQGYKPFLYPVLVILLIAVLFDQDLGKYLERRDEHARLQLAAEAADETLAQESRIKAAHLSLSPAFHATVLRTFVAPGADIARGNLQTQLQSMMQILYFDGVSFAPVDLEASGVKGKVALDAQFFGVPQQLPRLAEQLRSAAKDIQVESMEIKVVPDTSRGGQQLEIKARFVATYMLDRDIERATQPLAPASSPSAAKPAPAANNKRSNGA